MLTPCTDNTTQNENYFLSLPLEIITCIFKFLTIRDCGECMRVCHQWRDNIILLTADQPRSLRLSNYQLHFIRKPLRYFGFLVHGIEVHTSNISHLDVIERLAHLQLPRLKSLSIVIGLSSLSHSLASPSLSYLGQTVTRLEIKGNTFSESLVTILIYCPNLTHLCYRDNWMRSGTTTLLDESVTFPKLRFLAIESPNSDCTLVVSRSPNLRYLQYRNTAKVSFSLASILKACPTLECIKYSNQDTPLLSTQDPLWWQDERTKSDQVTGLHKLQVAITQAPLLHDYWMAVDQHYRTLRCLHMRLSRDCVFDGTITMAPLHIPEQLQEFTYHYTKTGIPQEHAEFAERFLLPILEGCHQLTHVSISLINQPLPSDAWSLLADLQQLTHFCIKSQYDSNEEMVALLKEISTRCIPLQELAYQGNWFNHATATESPLPPAIFAVLTTIPTLRHITINAECEGNIDKIIMSRCFKHLKRLPNLASLSFECLWGFTSEQVFRSLRNLPKLSDVSFYNCSFLNEKGMFLLIDRQPKLNKLSVERCTIDQATLVVSWEKYARSIIPHVVTWWDRIQ